MDDCLRPGEVRTRSADRQSRHRCVVVAALGLKCSPDPKPGDSRLPCGGGLDATSAPDDCPPGSRDRHVADPVQVQDVPGRIPVGVRLEAAVGVLAHERGLVLPAARRGKAAGRATPGGSGSGDLDQGAAALGELVRLLLRRKLRRGTPGRRQAVHRTTAAPRELRSTVRTRAHARVTALLGSAAPALERGRGQGLLVTLLGPAT